MYGDLQSTIKRLKRNVRILSERVDKLEEDIAKKADTTSSPKSKEELDVVPGKTPSMLKSKIQHIHSSYECVKILALEVFSEETLINSSISGKRSYKSCENGARPPLPQAILQIIEGLVREKEPGMTHKWFVEKLQSVQKVLRTRKKNATQ